MGANIGTTAIYFLKKFAPELKAIAFEPSAETFKFLRVNTILNDMENRMTLVNCGLGDKFDEMTMYRHLINPAANTLFKWIEGAVPETIKIIPLDFYLSENKIAAQEVKYIWLDTEGFEAQVLLGAKNLLKQNPVPIFTEFNPTAWNKSGYFERMMSLLKEDGYTHYIWIREMTQSGEEKLYPLEKLREFKDVVKGIGHLGDIFLVRNLTT